MVGELPGTNIVEYEFPLREGVIVTLFLPRDLTHDEVRRLTKYMDSLVDDPECAECAHERFKRSKAGV